MSAASSPITITPTSPNTAKVTWPAPVSSFAFAWRVTGTQAWNSQNVDVSKGLEIDLAGLVPAGTHDARLTTTVSTNDGNSQAIHVDLGQFSMPAATESAPGTIITPGTGYIVDASGRVFQISPAGVVLVAGLPDSSTYNVAKGILDPAGAFWQCNQGGYWYVKTLNGWAGGQTNSPMMSADGTYVSTVGPLIYDVAGNSYAINAAGQVVVNGAADARTSNVVGLLLYRGGLYQTNTNGNWFLDQANAWVSQTQDPRKPPPPPPTGGLYTVVNGGFRDPSGAVWKPKGLNVPYTRQWGSGSGNVDIGRTGSAALKRGFPGINSVRFLNYQGALASPTDPTVAAWINDLTSNGIAVIAEPHYSGNAVAGGDLTTMCQWLASFAAAYKNNPRVLFGSQNEPHGLGINAMALACYQAIRSVNGVLMWITMGNPGSELTSVSSIAQMHNVGIDAHYYGWMPSNGATWASQLATLAGAYKSMDGVVPVSCLEFGDSTSGQVGQIDGNWQQVIADALANPGGYSAFYPNWDASSADDLLGAPYDFSVLTAGGKMVAAGIAAP